MKRFRTVDEIIIYKERHEIKSYFPNVPFLYPLKTLENHTVFYFQGVQKGCIGNKSVKVTLILFRILSQKQYAQEALNMHSHLRL